MHCSQRTITYPLTPTGDFRFDLVRVIFCIWRRARVCCKKTESKTVRGIDRVSARTWMKERKRWNSTPLHSGCHTNAERRKRGGYSVLWLKRLLCSFSLFSPPAFNSDSRRVEAHSHHTLESRLRIDDNQRPAVHQTWLSGGCLYPAELLTTKSWQSNMSLD